MENLLSSGAISKIASGESVLKPVLQLTHIHDNPGDKKLVHLSDGSVAKVGCISKQMFISKKLEKGSVVQLTKFQYIKLVLDQPLFRGFLCLDLTVIRAKCDIIGHPKLIRLDDEPTQDRANVEQPPPTSKQNPSSSTSHSSTQNKKQKLQSTDHAITLFGTDISKMTKNHKTMAASAAVNLTSGAISKISSGSFTGTPVLQVTVIDARQHFTIDKKKCFLVRFSDGSFEHNGSIAVEAFVSNELQKGSVVQLTKFQLAKPFATCKGHILSNKRVLLCLDLTVIRTKCDIIGHPKLIRLDDEPTEDRANSHHAEKEPPTSKQNPSTSPSQNKKRKLQSGTADVSHVMKMTLENTLMDGLGACCDKLLTLEEAVSKMTSLMMDKNKLVAQGFTYFEENLSQMARSMIDIKNKQDDFGACLKKLETLEEDVSKLTRMMMEKSKEDDMGACIEKLDKLGWAAQDPMYDTALLLFGQTADYRKLWLHLKPESCGNWVKNAGSMFGLMD